jgi:hypothetical protein
MNTLYVPKLINQKDVMSPTFHLHSSYPSTWNGIDKELLLSVHPRNAPANPFGIIVDLSMDEFTEIFAHAKTIKILNQSIKVDDRLYPFNMQSDQRCDLHDAVMHTSKGNIPLNELLSYLDELLEKNEQKSPFSPLYSGQFFQEFSEIRTMIVASLNNHKLNQLTRLIGMGPGLTPSGDDYLIGLLAALTMFRPQALPSLSESMLQHLHSGPVTTDISNHYLKAACNGQFVEWFITFYKNFVTQKDWKSSLNLIAQMGHSSGTDTLLGFQAGILYSMQKDKHI